MSRFRIWPLIPALIMGTTSLNTPAPAQPTDLGKLHPANLRCEYLVNPLGIEERAPRLSWIVQSDDYAQVQTAYRILVASSTDRLDAADADLWDTGKVRSDATSQIAYAGKPLSSRMRCFWKVMSWDRDGNPGPWSSTATWEMGLLDSQDWHARWIDVRPATLPLEILSAVYYSTDGAVRKDVTAVVRDLVKNNQPVIASNDALGGDPAVNVPKRLSIDYRATDSPAAMHVDVAENATATLPSHRWPYLRRSFTADKPIVRARLYATALGMYEIYLNGQRVGDAHLAPGWTDYRKRVNYQVYDVTDQIQTGANAIGAIVAPGWFAGRAGLFHAQQFYGQYPALIAQLEITCADGSVQRIVSDDTWRQHPGPIMAADIMDGEIYDARAAIDDWCSPTRDDHDWQPVTTRDESRNLQAQIDQPVRILERLNTISLTQPKPGRWTFDLGQNMVGVVRLRIHGKPGQVITIRHGEMLNPDGTIYTANLRGAAATDTYICAGNGEETWQPRFTFHGFRYVQLTGLDEKPNFNAVTGIVLGSDVPQAGTFKCSNDDINQLQSNIVWGLRGNYLSIPTDCPQRDERMGWMGDAQAFIPTAVLNADIAPFMTKWMIDVDDAQRADGAYSDVSPVMNGLSFGTPAWADAGTIIPWTIYRTCGDTRILERHIDSMKRWVDWCKANSTDLIRDQARGNDYGDWLSINADTPKDLIGTAYFAHSTDIVARSLHALGRESEAQRYEQLFDDIRAAFTASYVDADGKIAGNTQCAYVLALQFNLLPTQALREKALTHLVNDIESKDDHLSTGFVGVANLLPVLDDNGRTDVAYRLLMQDTFPSWLFPVQHGATTIWERWNGWTPAGVHPDASMNSFNHYALGSCGQWFFEGIAGIRPDPQYAGFKHFFIRPQIGGPLTSAAAHFDSIHGRIMSQWSIADDQLVMKIRIPANTTATVVVPGPQIDLPPAQARGILKTEQREKRTILELGSGNYDITATTR